MASSLGTKEDRKVLIIGAGISGLVLAQILRKQNIPFEIFDRDESLEARTQGWSISLAESIPLMEELLPEDLGPFEVLGATYAAGLLDEVVLWDIEHDRALNKYGGEPKGQPGFVLRPYRPALRKYLTQNINIHINKKFTHYTQAEGADIIEAHFADGTSASGSILIGADGSKSHVRTQLVGKEASQVQLSEYQYVTCSEITLSKEQYVAFQSVTTTCVACPGDGVFFFIGANKARADGTADVFFGVCTRSEDPAAELKRIAANTKTQRIEEAKHLCEKHRLPWSLRQFFEVLQSEAVSEISLVLSEYSPPGDLPSGLVTIMGDAAHCMIPLKGAGANAAIIDACDLGRLLTEHWNNDVSMGWILKQYEEVALPRGQAQVSASRQAGQDPKGYAELVLKGRYSTIDAHAATT